MNCGTEIIIFFWNTKKLHGLLLASVSYYHSAFPPGVHYWLVTGALVTSFNLMSMHAFRMLDLTIIVLLHLLPYDPYKVIFTLLHYDCTMALQHYNMLLIIDEPRPSSCCRYKNSTASSLIILGSASQVNWGSPVVLVKESVMAVAQYLVYQRNCYATKLDKLFGADSKIVLVIIITNCDHSQEIKIY